MKHLLITNTYTKYISMLYRHIHKTRTENTWPKPSAGRQSQRPNRQKYRQQHCKDKLQISHPVHSSIKEAG